MRPTCCLSNNLVRCCPVCVCVSPLSVRRRCAQAPARHVRPANGKKSRVKISVGGALDSPPRATDGEGDSAWRLLYLAQQLLAVVLHLLADAAARLERALSTFKLVLIRHHFQLNFTKLCTPLLIHLSADKIGPMSMIFHTSQEQMILADLNATN
jgi:hypothetical protein